jgi:hypothetical protein
MTKTFFLALILILSGALADSAVGQSRQLRQNEIVPVKIRDLLRAEGFTVTIDKDNDVQWTIGGLFLYVTIDKDIPLLVCQSSVADKNNEVLTSNINNFNAKYYSKVYRGSGGVSFERAAYIVGGLPEENLMLTLLSCRTDFLRFINEVLP